MVSDKRMKPLTMTITGLVVVSCLVFGCATDLPVVKGPTSAAEALLSRVKRKAVNTCQLTRHSVEEISYLTKDSLQEIQETMQSSLRSIQELVSRQPAADDSHIWKELLAMKAQIERQRGDLISTQKQLQDTSADLVTTKTQLEDTRARLQDSDNKLEQTTADLLTTKAELQDTKSGLLTTQTELHNTKSGLLTTKTDLQDTQTDLLTTKTQLQNASSSLEFITADLQATKTALQVVTEQAKIAGSTFVRWGRTQCTDSSHLVYSGVVGGSHYSDTGAAVNALCLTLTPQFDNATTTHSKAWLYGAEYQHVPSHNDYDVPCAVCRVPQSTTIMMAATLTCPSGWTPQYTGHIVAGYPSHSAASEYRCLDGQPENVARSHQDRDGYLLFYTVAQCGSLPCGPYIQGKIITCVVCSM